MAHAGARSVRITSTPGGRYGALSRTVDAAPFGGKHVRLHGWVKTKDVTGWAAVWVRVDGGQATYVMSDGPIGTTQWSEVIADALIAQGRELTFGVAMGGDGTAWFDDLSLEVVKAVQPIELSGRVTDVLGSAVPRAEVALSDSAGAVAQHMLSSADGSFAFQTLAGQWALSANSPAHVGVFLETRAYTTSSEVPLVLGADGGVAVRGRVAGGAPDGAYVSIAAYSTSSGDVWAVPVATDGRFEAMVPRADKYAVSVLSGGAGSGVALRQGDEANAVLDVVWRREPPAAVLRWIAQDAIPLSTVDPNLPVESRDGLRALIGDARVVALGESTHGTREFFQLKHRIFRSLVDEGFTTFALEIGQVEARTINAYVQGGAGDARTALGAAGMWVWETEEVLALIEWMRSYNAHHATKLQFVGFDMQSPIASMQSVRAYLERISAAEARGWVAALDVLEHEAGLQAFMALSKERQAEVVSAVSTLNERFVASQKTWEQQTGPMAFAVARHDARNLQQATEQLALRAASKSGTALRDRAMAENIKWLFDTMPAGARMVVSAHNMHIADGPTRMGRDARAMLGTAWLSIGLEFGDGAFQALRARTDGAHANLEAIALSPPPLGSVNATLLHGPSVYALDLRRAPEGEVANWFHTPQLVREVGYVFRSESAMTTPQVLAERYDALLFVAHATRARPLAIDFTRLP